MQGDDSITTVTGVQIVEKGTTTAEMGVRIAKAKRRISIPV